MNVLDKLFYNLVDEGYIYTEDEKGQGMSYGEYFAIQDEFDKTIVDIVKECDDIESAAEALSYIVECGDDASIFFDRDAYQDFYCDIDEYTGKVNLYGVPDNLKEFFEELKEQYEDEHTVYEDEEIEMY